MVMVGTQRTAIEELLSVPDAAWVKPLTLADGTPLRILGVSTGAGAYAERDDNVLVVGIISGPGDKAPVVDMRPCDYVVLLRNPTPAEQSEYSQETGGYTGGSTLMCVETLIVGPERRNFFVLERTGRSRTYVHLA